MNEGEEQLTPIERPLLRSDLNEVRDTIHNMETLLLRWYEENKTWRNQSDRLVKRVANIERRLWVPTIISSVAAVLALLARFAP
jgi:hypothetical protein